MSAGLTEGTSAGISESIGAGMIDATEEKQQKIESALFRLGADLGGLRAGATCLASCIGEEEDLEPFEVERMLLGLIESVEMRRVELVRLLGVNCHLP